MKFADYVKRVNEMLEKNPELGECKVIYSSDDEGNSYTGVHFDPTPGYLSDDEYFYSKASQTDDEEDFVINSVCIN